MNRILLALTLIISSNALATPTAERIQEIKQIAGVVARPAMFADVAIRDNAELPVPAGAFKLPDGSYLIQINPNIMNTLSEAGRNFILYHELAHIRLGHVNMPWPGFEAGQEYELEADVYATLLYKHLHGVDQGFLDFLAFIATMTDTQPSGPDRARLCESVLVL